jgi:hypothetical protein
MIKEVRLFGELKIMTTVSYDTFKIHSSWKTKLTEEQRLEASSKIEYAIVVETIKTLIVEEVGVKNLESSQESVSKLADFLGLTAQGNTAEEMMGDLTKNILSAMDSALTDEYKKFMGQEMFVYRFQDFQFGDSLIPKKGNKIGDMFIPSEKCLTLGTGEYDKDENGNDIPNDPNFVKECLFEILHFLSHTDSETHIYDPNREPVLSKDWFINETIYCAVKPNLPIQV